MATQTPKRREAWLSAEQLRKLTAADPDEAAAPPPRTDEPRSSRPRAFAIGLALLAVAVIVLLLL
jgi:hypothetical protein